MKRKLLSINVEVEPEKIIKKKERKQEIEELKVICPGCKEELIFHEIVKYLNGEEKSRVRTLISPKYHHLYNCLRVNKAKEVGYREEADCCHTCAHWQGRYRCGEHEMNLTPEEMEFIKEYEGKKEIRIEFWSSEYGDCKHYTKG